VTGTDPDEGKLRRENLASAAEGFASFREARSGANRRRGAQTPRAELAALRPSNQSRKASRRRAQRQRGPSTPHVLWRRRTSREPARMKGDSRGDWRCKLARRTQDHEGRLRCRYRCTGRTGRARKTFREHGPRSLEGCAGAQATALRPFPASPEGQVNVRRGVRARRIVAAPKPLHPSKL